MTDKQLIRLATGVQNLAIASNDLLRLAKELAETNKYQALHISKILEVITESNVMLGKFAGEVIPEN